MTNLAKWGATSLTTVMSTELNSLTNATGATSSSTYDNSTNRYPYCDIEVFLNITATTPTAGSQVCLTLIEKADGTNLDTEAISPSYYMETLLMVVMPTGVAANTAQRIVARGLPLPPAVFSLLFSNVTGTTLPASGNTVKILAYGYNLNA